jgi:hypothetical protein
MPRKENIGTLVRVAVLAASLAARASLASEPVKLDVQVDRQSVSAGDPIALTVTLLDAANHPAPAPKNITLTVQRRLPSQPPEKLTETTLLKGASSIPVKVSLRSPGLQYLWVKNAELLPGGVNVFVNSASGASPTPLPQGRGSTARALEPVLRPPVPASPAKGGGTSGRAPASVASAAAITLRTSPDRVFLANGRDFATVEAFLMGSGSAPADMKLNVFDSAGTLNPSPIVIPRGKSVGLGRISATQPGTYTVEFLGSDPDTPFDGNKKIDVRFGPPVTQLLTSVSPSRISLLDYSDVIVRLADENGRTVATDTPRVVSLAIVEGKGEIRPAQVTIGANQFEARSVFYPGEGGVVKISASAANLLTREVEVPVSRPVSLLAISAAGGLVGGYLVSLRKSRKKESPEKAPESAKSSRSIVPLLVTGLVTGFLLYWACIFLGLSSVANGAILNPMNAFAFSVVGGWLQTRVFATITKRIQA